MSTDFYPERRVGGERLGDPVEDQASLGRQLRATCNERHACQNEVQDRKSLDSEIATVLPQFPGEGLGAVSLRRAGAELVLGKANDLDILWGLAR